jgi:hypothetical protein
MLPKDPTSLTASTILDLSKKDPNNTISYLSLITAIACLGFSGFLVKRMLDDAKEIRVAQKNESDSQRRDLADQFSVFKELSDNIKSSNENYGAIIDRISKQNEELGKRPCALSNEQFIDMIRGRMGH